jgi:hypothetical protein
LAVRVNLHYTAARGDSEFDSGTSLTAAGQCDPVTRGRERQLTVSWHEGYEQPECWPDFGSQLVD